MEEDKITAEFGIDDSFGQWRAIARMRYGKEPWDILPPGPWRDSFEQAEQDMQASMKRFNENCKELEIKDGTFTWIGPVQ